MNIVCLNPPFKTEFGKFSRTSRSPAVTKSGTVYYPIWLCYAAGSLEKSGHKVKVIDSCAERINLAKTIEKIKKFNPDLVLLDTSTPSILSDLESGRLIKESVKNPFIVLMGTHPSSLPDETLRNEKAINAIQKSAFSGKIGDGKIFISNIDQVIRIRTGEKGKDAV